MSYDKSIKFWNFATSTTVHSIDDAHSAYIISLAYHNNNKPLLASGSIATDYLIKIWNTVTYLLVATLGGHTNPVRSLAFDPSRPDILASGSFDRSIKIWDLNVADPSTANSLVTTLSTHTNYVFTVTFETTGLMASGDSAGFIIIWETNITVKFKINSVILLKS